MVKRRFDSLPGQLDREEEEGTGNYPPTVNKQKYNTQTQTGQSTVTNFNRNYSNPHLKNDVSSDEDEETLADSTSSTDDTIDDNAEANTETNEDVDDDEDEDDEDDEEEEEEEEEVDDDSDNFFDNSPRADRILTFADEHGQQLCNILLFDPLAYKQLMSTSSSTLDVNADINTHTPNTISNNPIPNQNGKDTKSDLIDVKSLPLPHRLSLPLPLPVSVPLHDQPLIQSPTLSDGDRTRDKPTLCHCIIC